ncbi:MAG: membrane protein [Sulfurovum sp. FS08-3]|nr:MAG: membrane protein [Sulfurovum sp. FS08-3]
MKQETIQKIINNPDYQELVKKRGSFSINLSIAMLVIYFAFILTIAFDPSLLATPLSEGSVTTVGIPIGILVIISAFVLTGIYTKRANGEFDDLVARVKDSIKEA